MSFFFRFWPKMTLLMRTGGVTKIILCGAHFYTYIIAPFYAFLRISALMYTFTRGVEVGIPTRVDRFSNLKNCKYFWKKLKSCKYFEKKYTFTRASGERKNAIFLVRFWNLKSCKVFVKNYNSTRSSGVCKNAQESAIFGEAVKTRSKKV